MGFIFGIWDWMNDHQRLAQWLGLVSLAMFVGTLVFLPAAVAYLPADYFTHRRPAWPTSPLGWAIVVAKNLLGVVFLLMGLAMLVLPGQGVLTMLIGIMLLNFPGKRGWELWLVRRKGLRSTIDWMRRKAGKPPLDYGS